MVEWKAAAPRLVQGFRTFSVLFQSEEGEHELSSMEQNHSAYLQDHTIFIAICNEGIVAAHGHQAFLNSMLRVVINKVPITMGSHLRSPTRVGSA